MYVTYLIGNGFDLNVGLKTRYSDFLQEYLLLPSSSNDVQKGKALIREQMVSGIDSWADMELALGRLTQEYKIITQHEKKQIESNFKQGPKIRFTDFLEEYLRMQSDSADKQKSKELIGEQMNNGIDAWDALRLALEKPSCVGDAISNQQRKQIIATIHTEYHIWFENQFNSGFVTDKYINKEKAIASFLTFCSDLVQHLSAYLRNQEAKFNFTQHEIQICSAFMEALTNPLVSLRVPAKQMVDTVWKNLSRQALHYAFISFNYTTVFDKCLQLAKDKVIAFQSRPGKSHHVIHLPVLHIHGTLKEDMILAVNDVSQIRNQAFRIPSFSNAFVKPNLNQAIKRNRDIEAESIIENSQIIITFGLSLGDTDRIWWSRIHRWLATNTTRHLIIFFRDNQANSIAPFNFAEIYADIQNRIIQCCDSVTPNIDIRQRVHVVVNEALFPIPLV